MVIEVTFDTTDVYISTTVSPVYVNVSFEAPSGGGGAVWGDITGTLSDQTDLQSALDAKVPYTGATTNVNLGEYEIKAGQVTLDTSPTGTAAVGTTRWNDTTGLTETTLKGGNVILKNGVDLVARVVNKVSPNTTLTKAAYQAVRVSGAQGQRLAVALAQANNDANSADTIGLVTETIATNQEGFIMTVGQLENINTTGSLQSETWADGDVLYLSPTIAGAITKVKPTGNGHIVVIGYVEYAHANNGKIYVKVMNGWELDELHDVAIVTPLNNEALIYESATALWKNKSIATALGYTPANSATTLTINGVTYDLSTSRTWSVGSVTGSGASGQVAYWDGTTSQAGSNNLFWRNVDGYLGLGTTNPLQKLHIVDGAIQLTDAYPIRWGTSNLLYGSTTGLDITNTSFAVRFRFTTGGNLLVNTTTDGGQRLQVQGTTLLNGNVTFSSATGMTWDATNSRLGIGLNNPAQKLDILGTDVSIIKIKTSTNTGAAILQAFNDVNSSASFGIFGSTRTPVGTINSGDGYMFAANDIAISSNGNVKFGNSTNERMRIFSSTGNVLIQNGGTFTDSGERLQVTGTMKVTGLSNFYSGAYFDSVIQLGFASTNTNTSAFSNSTAFPRYSQNNSINRIFYDNGTYNPTSGTGTYSAFETRVVINQTGGANGITRGLYVNPTLTSAADFRAIETTSGNVLFGSGFFWDNTNSRLGIGTNTPIAPLDVVTSATTIINRIRTTSTINSTNVALLFQDGTTGTNSVDGLYLGRSSAINYLWTYETEPLAFGTSNSERMRIFAGGNVALGSTTDTGERLQVTGTMKVTGNNTTGILNVINNNTSLSLSIASLLAPSATGDTFFTVGRSLSVNQSALFAHSNVDGGGNFYACMVIYGRPASDFAVSQTGRVGIGIANPNASARLQIESTTQGFLPPRMTTTQKNAISSPAAGLVVYDTTDNKHYGYNGTTWNAFY